MVESYGNLPLSFESNEGQTDPRVTFLSRSPGCTLFLTHSEAVFVLRDSETVQRPESKPANQVIKILTKKPETESVVAMRLVGANPKAYVSGVEVLPGKSNYFLGNDSKKWRTNIPTYAKVHYKDIYLGVDLVYYGSERELEYDFVVAPGGDPKVIELEFQGADKIRVDAQGDLIMQLGAGELLLRQPVIYQMVNGVRKSVLGSYVLRDKQLVSFRVAAHDPLQMRFI